MWSGGCWLVLIAVVVLFLGSDLRSQPTREAAHINGPYALLLASSTDLGPSTRDAQLTAALHNTTRPDALMSWARGRGLSVRWRSGDNWAIVAGAAPSLAGALNVTVHDYKGRRGQVFYASAQQPAVPRTLRGEVSGLGRILGYLPYHVSRPAPALDVPNRGLTPSALLNTYDVNRLAAKGFTGKGTTIIFFEFDDGYKQSDLDAFAATFGLPRFTPTNVGRPGTAQVETTMDLEVAHAIAPDAREVVVNARSTAEGDGTFEKVAQMLETTDRQFPGAVWNFSIGWGCDKLITAADLAPVRSALALAHAHGTTAFDASGDLAGLECRGGQDWSSPPGPADIGLDSVASLPEMTDVGGTTLSTDVNGRWLAEQAWFNVPLSQGTGGGVSALLDRPVWQAGVSSDHDATHRLTPDVAAVADPFTGVKIVIDGEMGTGGGTSQSAPLWAGMAAVMNQFLVANGGRAVGDLNPMLYRIAAGAPLPAFRDVTLGGNAIYDAQPGYDLVTGLGTPDLDNLANDLLALQKAPA